MSDHTYDFAIIGSGSAGAIIAARLTENPNINVVVAKHRLTKEYIHIEDVVWGRWTDAECSDCGDVLTAKKGNEVS